MGVATHLGIKLEEYDARIGSFIPEYEEMLDVAARAIPASATKTNSTRKVAVGTDKKSMDTNWFRWLSRKAFQV